MTDSALPKPAAARYRSGVLGLRLAQSLLLCCCGRLSPSQPAHPSLALASPYPAHSLDALISTRLPRHRSHLRREAAQEAAHLHHPRRRGLVRTLREDLDSCGGSAEMITGGRRQGGRRGRPRRPRRKLPTVRVMLCCHACMPVGSRGTQSTKTLRASCYFHSLIFAATLLLSSESQRVSPGSAALSGTSCTAPVQAHER